MTGNRIPKKDPVVPRCTEACPAGVDVPQYIRAVRDGDYDRAVAVLRERIPLPTVCADACFAPCEDVCAYKQFGDPIAIRALKRAAVDKGGDSWKRNKNMVTKTGKKAAIVGAGPAGLTAAYYLATLGHDVTVFDEFPKPGGMMRYGIPSYRLPEERLEKDVSDILELGVSFRGETQVGKDISLESLREDFDVVFLASGANSSVRIPLEGSDKAGVLWGWDFLKDCSKGVQAPLGGKVVVVGGGNVALDVALTASRLGAQSVDLYCLENREEMPAHPWEVALAEEEGVGIHNSWGPDKILGGERATGICFKRCLSVFDPKGAFNPVYENETTLKAEAEHVILAIGQTPKLDYLTGMGVDNTGRSIATEVDLSTNVAGVFAGGDVVSGPDSIIGAIAQGRQAAEAMDKYLGGAGDISESLAAPEEEVWLSQAVVEPQPRKEMKHLKVWERSDNFGQVELGLGEAAIKAEASRCLCCDVRNYVVVLNTESCKECGYCAEVCDVETFGPASNFNLKGYRPMEVKSSKWCVGCFKCFFSCPDFAIDIKAVTA